MYLCCPLQAFDIPQAPYLFRFHHFQSLQLPPTTQITQQFLCDAPFSMIYPQAIFIRCDLFQILPLLCQVSLTKKKKREERQREQTKPVSVTKIPAVERKWNPCGLCSPSNSSIIMHRHILHSFESHSFLW